ncbi:MAG: efflux RND transporter periplasmic adaptor subunit [Pseudomonadota bacterium]
MKTILIATVVGLLTLAGGYWLGQHQSHDASVGATSDAGSGEREILYYKAPMDPNYRRDEPGKSPMGMDLVPVYADEASGGDAGAVKISPTVVNNLGVRTAPVEVGALSREIETVGYIGYDEDTLHKISTRVDGWIERLLVDATGDPVEQGQALFELYSPTLVNAQEEYIAALQSRNTALHAASRARLAALGVSASEIKRLEKDRRVRQRITVYAPQSGVVAHLGVREGQFVTEATDIMSIGSLEEVWLMAEVFERQSGWLAAGQMANVTLDALGSMKRTGTVDYVYPELDPKTRTLSARIRLNNADKALKPNMFARARIRAAAIENALYVPQEALIRGGRVDRVVLATGEGTFRAQPVSVGIESGNRVQITKGVSRGDTVVTSGQFLIDSESNIDTALARMDTAAGDQDTPMGEMQHDSMSATQHDRAAVMATVKAVDRDARTITLEHGPIQAWSMPGMTMVFDVDEQVELSSLGKSASVHAEIERRDSGRFVVAAVHAMAQGEHTASSSTSATAQRALPDTADMMATVKAVDHNERTITLSHETIEAWMMPGMTMAFAAPDDLDLANITVGTRAHVDIERLAPGRFAIVEFHPLPAARNAKSDDHADHDMSGHDMSGHDDGPNHGDKGKHEGHEGHEGHQR